MFIAKLWPPLHPQLFSIRMSPFAARGHRFCQRVFRAPDAARRLPPWRSTSAAQPRRLLPPVRPGVGTDDSAAGAHHAWAERWHRHVSGHGSALRIARWWHSQQYTRATARRWRACYRGSLGPRLGSGLLGHGGEYRVGGAVGKRLPVLPTMSALCWQVGGFSTLEHLIRARLLVTWPFFTRAENILNMMGAFGRPKGASTAFLRASLKGQIRSQAAAAAAAADLRDVTASSVAPWWRSSGRRGRVGESVPTP